MIIASQVSPTELRRACGEWATGVAIVTTVNQQGEPVGLAVNSFTSVSLDPPLILFCPARESATWSHIRTTGRFVVNILAAEQAALARVFSLAGIDKFANVDYHQNECGLPVLDGVTAYLTCATEDVYDGGDHEIVVARVHSTHHTAREPLVFHRGATTDLRRK